MKKTFLIIVTLIIALKVFSVLYTSPAEINLENSQRIHIGMTTAEVEEIMGKPIKINDTCSGEGNNTYIYSNVFGTSDNIRFCFSTNNKVTGINRD